MKYVFLLGAVALVYVVLIRQSPLAQVKQTATQVDSADSGVNLKRPINRTHEVLDQVKKRNGNGEF